MPFWKCFACLRFQNEEIITKLDRSNCALTDVPPDISQHERTLEELYLSSNRIRALSPQLFYCQGLKALHVNDNELESLPIAIGSLKHLQNLNLSRLSSIPDNIKTCKNLTRLDLSLNNLQRLPDAITSLISLQELLLNETNLEFLPANFGRLVNLRILELRSNNLMTLPKSMSRLSNLNRIDIGANEFTELPEVICQLSQLRELWIDVNRIRRISPNVSNLRELKHFEANNNLLTTLPNEISHWRNLEVLSVATNDMESLPFSIGMLKNLVTLQCDANQLRDLPDSICHLENLEEMVISHNFILRLPSTIGMLRKLRFFCADENILRSLPAEICSCINLAVLSVRSNKITELPQNIGHLFNLHVLNLVDNFITYLPVSVLSLTKLTALWISDNQSQPLVPLQYLNASTKMHLTCFMLPQQGTYKQSATQINEYSDNNSTNSWFHHQDQEKRSNVYNSKENAVSGTSQKLLFADDNKSDPSYISRDNSTMASPHSQGVCFTNDKIDLNATFIAQSCSQTSPSRRICFADEVKGAETLATRLMRSPTPYPKELRLLAKYVRNNHAQPMQQRHAPSYTDTLVTAQSVRSTAVGTSAEAVDEKNYLTTPASGGVPAVESVKEARVLLNPSGSSGVLQQLQNPLSYTNLNERNLEPKLQAQPIFPNRSNSKNMVNGLQAVYTAENTVLNHSSQLPQQQMYYQQYQRNPIQMPQPNMKNDQSYPHSLSMYDQQFREALYDSSGSFRQLNASPCVLSSYSQQGSQQPQNIVYSIEISKPPPYHIARAFTKKSREDLLNYETFRQIHHADTDDQQNVEMTEENCDNVSLQNSQHEKLGTFDNANLNGHNSFDNTFCNGLNDNDYNTDPHNNNTHCLNSTFTIDSDDAIMSRQATPSPRSQKSRPIDDCSDVRLGSLRSNQSQRNSIAAHSPEGTLDSDSGIQDNQLSVGRVPPRSNSTTAWLFGLHKNPTVKQVAIKRDQEIGFEIQEKPEQGIFVCSIHPNTSAATLLHTNDKLLEVDGYDFTKIRLVDAQQILNNSGPIINVMISRT